MKKRKTALVAVFFVMGAAALGLIVMGYAKYTSQIENTGTATVAKWAFTSDNTGGDITCPLDHTYDTDTLVAGKIAPGTSGRCPIEISNAQTEVGIDYSIALPSTITGQPKNMKFYSDAAHTAPLTSSTPITGTLEPKAAATTVYIYWEWPYEDNPSTAAYDAYDTSDGEAAASMTMTFTVTGTQVQPTF